ncbi:MAG: hypothetical protein AMJ43_09820 [Coxiella sp. DG_40]|nr:MAG: hypothetical protein AMJ43_09820 [Coxiella sp. DG_40]
MAESKEDREKRLLRELEGKNVTHYGAILSAWIRTKMERDKVLLTLSAGGVGLLVTIFSTVGVKHWWEILLYGIAVIFFVTTITVCILIYDRNSKHLEDVLRERAARDYVLERYDKLSRIFFIVAVVVSMGIGAVTAYNKLSELNKKGNIQMCDEKKTEKTMQEEHLEEKSISGIDDLRPAEPEAPSDQGGPRESTGQTDSGKQSD